MQTVLPIPHFCDRVAPLFDLETSSSCPPLCTNIIRLQVLLQWWLFFSPTFTCKNEYLTKNTYRKNADVRNASDTQHNTLHVSLPIQILRLLIWFPFTCAPLPSSCFGNGMQAIPPIHPIHPIHPRERHHGNCCRGHLWTLCSDLGLCGCTKQSNRWAETGASSLPCATLFCQLATIMFSHHPNLKVWGGGMIWKTWHAYIKIMSSLAFLPERSTFIVVGV